MKGKFWSIIVENWKAAVFGAVTFVLGVVATNYTNFHSDRRGAIQSEYDAVIQAENQLNDLIIRFMAIAAGEQPTTDGDIDALASELLTIKSNAYNIVLRAPAVGPQYEALEDRMVELVQAAEALSANPLDNKPFVAAVSDYALASDAFKKAVAQVQGKLSLL